MVILDMAARISRDVRVLTLDTGRLPQETYAMIESVRERYGVTVEVVSPDAAEVESMVSQHGPNLFYQEPALRTLCCHIRKVRPLERKLRELDAWAVGLRRQQGETREGVPKVDLEATPVKLSPLADWTKEQVEEYLRRQDVPRHPLYEQGYASIGCAPCTRPVRPGEHDRAGRWWWEEESHKECGIHFGPNGKVRRTLDVLLEEVLSSDYA